MRGLHGRLQEGAPWRGRLPQPPGCPAPAPQPAAAPAAGEEGTLQHSVCKGLKEAAAAQAKALAEGGRDILDIINGELVPALDQVGQGFEKGTLFLPQLLMSAEAAKGAFQVLRAPPAGRARENPRSSWPPSRGTSTTSGKIS